MNESTFKLSRKVEQVIFGQALSTVDFAAIDLNNRGEPVTVRSIHDLIASEPEWAPKLDRAVFSDSNIQRAIARLRELFPNES